MIINDEVTRKCSQCNKIRPLTEFPKSGGRAKYGRSYWCRTCIAEKNREYRAANRDRIRSQQAEYRERNREKLARSQSERYQNRDHVVHQERSRRSILKVRYRITPDQYDQIMAMQNGLCAICGNSPSGRSRRLVVDHDHFCCPARETCGKCLRGLLCGPCNLKLGWLEKYWPEIAKHVTGKLVRQ